MSRTRVLHIGLGPLGAKVLQFVHDRPDQFELVGAVDINPNLSGKDVGEVCGDGKWGVSVSPSFDKLDASADPDVAIVTTVSDIERFAEHAESVMKLGCDLVSTCEELLYPWNTEPDLARRLDEQAKSHDVSVLGTGINPGFLMDYLPSVMTAISQKIDRVVVERVQDATFRRVPFQKKIGAGLTLEQFEEKRKQGTLRHVGLTESVHLVAAAVGWRLDDTVDDLSPIVAEKMLKTDAMTIEPGMAAGVQQIGRGIVGGEEKISLVFRAAVGEPDPRDTITIEGEPKLHSRIDGGVNGDVGTAAITANAARSIAKAPPGLRTMLDIPIVTFGG